MNQIKVSYKGRLKKFLWKNNFRPVELDTLLRQIFSVD